MATLLRFQNTLLDRLSEHDAQEIVPHLQRLDLIRGQMIYVANTPINDLTFIELGIVSVVTIFEDGTWVECGLVGNEGMLGMQLLTGIDRLSQNYMIQATGKALQISVPQFNKVVSTENQLHNLILQFGYTLTTQAMQLAACNVHHTLKERCCRWLLMWSDRDSSIELDITQEFLSVMLGVRRASVSEIVHALKDAGMLTYSRGKIKLVDIDSLKATSCECYTILKNDYNRMLSS